jgi:hypothetical protein
MREMLPGLIPAKHLTNLMRDLSNAQRERESLRVKRTRTAAETTRLAELDRLARQSWEVFIWTYRAPGQAEGFRDAVNEFFATVPTGSPPRNEDYAFWIRTGVRWLVEKRRARGITSWESAVRAFNGSGPRANAYRDAVVARARDALAAQRAGQPFIPRD